MKLEVYIIINNFCALSAIYQILTTGQGLELFPLTVSFLK